MRAGVGDEDYEDGVAVPGPMFRPVESHGREHGTELVEAQEEVRCVDCGRTFPAFTSSCPHDGADVVGLDGEP